MEKGGLNMNVRKIFLMIACVFSGVSVFLPFYYVQLNGETVEDGAISMMPSYYGIAILVLDILIIGFTFVGLKKGYIITSLINVGVSIYAVIYSSINKESAKSVIQLTGKMMQTLSLKGEYNYSIEDGPGFFMLLFSAVLVLIMMFWNFANNDD